MTFDNYNLNSIWLKISQYQNIINTVIVAGLSLYLVSFAAELTWRLLPSSNLSTVTSAPTGNQTTQSQSTQRANIQKITNLYLFGQENAPKVEAPVEVVVEDAPETRLNLTLTGAVSSSENEGGAAIIENKGKQNTYGIGEKIDGTNAFVQQVLNDRIIIKNGPKLETLMLDGFDFEEQNAKRAQQSSRITATQPKPLSNARPVKTVQNTTVTNAAREARKNPENFTQLVSIAPLRENGQMLGFRANPGRDPKFFKQAGFEPNDIIIDINGIDVTDVRQSIEAMQLLRASDYLDITLMRNDEPITISIDLTSQLDEQED